MCDMCEEAMGTRFLPRAEEVAAERVIEELRENLRSVLAEKWGAEAEIESLRAEAAEDHTNMALLVNSLYREVEKLRAQLAEAETNYNALARVAVRQAKDLDTYKDQWGEWAAKRQDEIRYRSIGPQEPLD